MKYRAHANQWRMQSWSQGGCAYAVGASRVSPPDLKKNHNCMYNYCDTMRQFMFRRNIFYYLFNIPHNNK